MTAPWRTDGSVERVIPAPPDVIYRLVTDVTSTGERSLDCRRCHWLPGAPPATAAREAPPPRCAVTSRRASRGRPRRVAARRLAQAWLRPWKP